MSSPAQIVKLNPKKLDDVIAKVRRIEQLFSKRAPEIIRDANQEALVFIQKRALKNLETSMRASRRPFRTGALEEAIMDPQYSEANGFGIRFFIDERIRPDVPYYGAVEYGSDASVGRQVPFIFLGTPGGRTGIGNSRKSPKLAYSLPQHNDRYRGNAPAETVQRGGRNVQLSASRVRRNRVTDRIVGPSELDRLGGSDPNVKAKRNRKGHIVGGGVRLVTVTRPVPAYHYGERAGDTFLASDTYSNSLNRLIKRSGLDAVGISFVITGR